MTTIADAMAHASALLAAAGIEDARREASSMLMHVTGRNRTFLIAHPEHCLKELEAAAFEVNITRRAAGEPFHYITGIKEFYGLDFEVGPDVLIPRPETELIVEEALKLSAARPRSEILEIGVGSGCISIAILVNSKGVTATATDISPGALTVASRNAERHGVRGSLQLIQGDAFAGVSGKFDIIVTNPPYIPETDRQTLATDVVDFEPHAALFSGRDGLDLIRRIVAEAPSFLVPGGTIIIEIGFGQSDAVRALFRFSIWRSVTFRLDLQGIERTVVATLAD